MKKILSIAKYTLLENIRNKIFYVIILFGVIVTASSLLLSALGGEQEKRVLLDVGIGSIEFFSLITAIFASVSLILEELESKTIYLVLTRPVSRAHYLIGRFIGLMLAVFAGMFLMSLIHLGLLMLKDWQFTLRYPLVILMSFAKICIISGLAMFFSLFTTSAISSVSFTVFAWIIGHFSEEIRFLGNNVSLLIPKIFAKAAYYTMPNLQYFNLKDYWDVPNIVGPWMVYSFIYGLLYLSSCLLLSAILFSRKEF